MGGIRRHGLEPLAIVAEQGAFSRRSPERAGTVSQQAPDGVIRQACFRPQGAHDALLEQVEPWLRGGNPDGAGLAFGQRLDPVVNKGRLLYPRVVFKARAIEAGQTRLGAYPEEAVPALQEGHGGVLEQAVLAAPRAVRVGRQGPVWIEREGQSRGPEPRQQECEAPQGTWTERSVSCKPCGHGS